MQQEKDCSKAEDLAYAINGRLHEKYTLEEKTMQPTYKATGYNSKPTKEGENCDCGLPREYREGIKNGKKWRAMFCKKKACKPIWLPNLKDMERSNFEDQLTDESNKQIPTINENENY